MHEIKIIREVIDLIKYLQRQPHDSHLGELLRQNIGDPNKQEECIAWLEAECSRLNRKGNKQQ